MTPDSRDENDFDEVEEYEEEEEFDPGWLALREPFDALARSEAIAGRLLALLPARPRLVDLGAGTGALLRWLAPRIGRAQAWTLVDSDPVMAEAAFEVIAGRAEGIGWRTTMPNRRTLLVHAPGGAWRVESLIADLAEAPRGLPVLQQADAVLSSALGDLVSAGWIERLAAAIRVPFYAALCVDGRDRLHPPHPADAVVAAGFRRDQGRDKGFGGKALGPRAPAAIARAFAGRGFAVTSAASDWVLPGRDPGALPGLRDAMPDFLARLLLDRAAAAERQARSPAQRRAIQAWGMSRLDQAERRRLTLRIGHRDLLAVPPPPTPPRAPQRPAAPARRR